MRAQRWARTSLFWAVVVGGVSLACTSLRTAEDVGGGVEPGGGEQDDASARDDARSAQDAGGPCTKPAPDDPENCGKCGRSCLGGACESGTCKPAVIATGRRAPVDITVRGPYVYWVEAGLATGQGKDGRLARADVAPCAGSCVVDLVDAGAPFTGVAATDAYVYFTQGGGGTGRLARYPLDGTPVQVVAPNEPDARRVAVDATSAFWLRPGTGGNGVMRRRFHESTVDGGVSILTDLDYPAGLAIDATHVFVTIGGVGTSDGFLGRADLDGTNPQELATGLNQPRGVAVDPTWVYWVNRGDGTLHRARHDGSTGTTLVDVARSPNAVAVDGASLCWTEQGTAPDFVDGRLRCAGVDGQNVVTLADALHSPSALALTPDAVFVALRGDPTGTGDGMILRVRRP